LSLKRLYRFNPALLARRVAYCEAARARAIRLGSDLAIVLDLVFEYPPLIAGIQITIFPLRLVMVRLVGHLRLVHT
jgi:hypothetical protein